MTGQTANRSHWECPRCAALGGHPCVYTTGNGIHHPPGGGRYVENVVGQPMTRMHHERPRIRCVPIGATVAPAAPPAGNPPLPLPDGPRRDAGRAL